MFMYVYIVCRVASQGWSRMILYLWSFYSRSYFANYSLPPSVNIHRSDRVASLITDYRLYRGPTVFPEVWGRWHRPQTPRGPRCHPESGQCSQRNPQYKDLCVEVSGGHTSPVSPLQTSQCNNPSGNLFPAKYDLFELFMIFLFDHKVSFNWARSRTAWLTDSQSPSSNSSFYCGPCYLCLDSLLPGSSEQSPGLWLDTTCLTPHTGPGELWPSWNLSGSDWHFRHMDGLTPKKLDPNKMLTQEAK